MWLKTIFSPASGWSAIKESVTPTTPVFWRVTLPLSLVAPISHYLWIVLTQGFPGPVAGAFTSFFSLIVNIALVYMFAATIHSLAEALRGRCDMNMALALSSISVAPWYLALALFPVIGGYSFLGLAWTVVVYLKGKRVLEIVPEAKQLRFSVTSLFLFVASILLTNLLFAGVLSILFATMGIGFPSSPGPG